MNFDLLAPDVYKRLHEFDWFHKAIGLKYRAIAKSYGCNLVLSKDRLLQVHDIFWDDVRRGKQRHLPEGTETLNQFKMGGYLCFWLRRINPIQSVGPDQNLGDRGKWLESGERLSKSEELFIAYGNEICALTISMQITHYLSYIANRDENVVPLQTAINAGEFEALGSDEVVEFAKIMKYKNISSHGLNMSLQMMCRIGINPQR